MLALAGYPLGLRFRFLDRHRAARYGWIDLHPDAPVERLRVGVDTLAKDLVMAGAGAYSGSQAGTLNGFFASILPYCQGGNPALDDGAGLLFSERFTML